MHQARLGSTRLGRRCSVKSGRTCNLADRLRSAHLRTITTNLHHNQRTREHTADSTRERVHVRARERAWNTACDGRQWGKLVGEEVGSPGENRSVINCLSHFETSC